MTNPWLRIPHEDYENHMTEVGQAQVLSELTDKYLKKYSPKSFALLGCSTGNGLEHIDSKATEHVYAIDINSDYIARLQGSFEGKIENLHTICMDIQKDDLRIKDIDLFFIGLVLEYVNPAIALEKVIATLKDEGILALVFQHSCKATFVSKTSYQSLEKLTQISTEVDEQWINGFLQSRHMKIQERYEVALKKGKSFVVIVSQLS
jgi:SAM-dependent methyltransferase